MHLTKRRSSTCIKVFIYGVISSKSHLFLLNNALFSDLHLTKSGVSKSERQMVALISSVIAVSFAITVDIANVSRVIRFSGS